MEEQLAPVQSKGIFSKPHIKYGVIGGICSTAVTYSFYAINEKLFMNKMLAYLPVIIMVGFAIYAAIAKKAEAGGYIIYGNAFVVVFVTFLISLMVSSIFGLLLYLV